MQLWPSPPVHGFRPKQRASEEREGSEVLGGTASPPLPSNFQGKGTRGIQNLENSNHRSQLFLGEDDSIWATREKRRSLFLVERSRTLSFLIYEDLVQSATLGPIPRQPLLFPEQFSVDTSTQQRIDNAQVPSRKCRVFSGIIWGRNPRPQNGAPCVGWTRAARRGHPGNTHSLYTEEST